jgi:hypothetical protein
MINGWNNEDEGIMVSLFSQSHLTGDTQRTTKP